MICLIDMNIQLIGKVTGLDYDQTFEKFLKYEKRLQMEGHMVTNPMRIVPKDAKWEDAMKTTLAALDEQDAVFLLPDWIHSQGSKDELKKAIEKDLQILTFYEYENCA